MMMKKGSASASASASRVWLCLVVLAAALLVRDAEAVTCSPLELSPCIPAVTSSSIPSGQCCAKLREQRPCLCGYLRNPSLRSYVNSPNARRVAVACAIPFPQC